MSDEFYELAIDIARWYDDYDPYGFMDAFDTMEDGIDAAYGLLVEAGPSEMRNQIAGDLEDMIDSRYHDDSYDSLINEGYSIISRLEKLEKSQKKPAKKRNVQRKLMICPCCMEGPRLYRDGKGWYYECTSCYDCTVTEPTPEKAMEAWNAGITPDYIEEQLWEKAEGDEREFKQLMREYIETNGGLQ